MNPVNNLEPLMLDEYDTSLLFENRIMDLDDVAILLKVSKKTIYRLAQKGSIPSSRVGKAYRFLSSEILLWMKNGGKNEKGI
jgi:excisionase family DNA binding protein